MSETVTYKGKLQPVTFINNVEETCKDICNSKGIIELDDYNKTWKEQLYDSFYTEYVVHNNRVFKVIEKEDYEFDDIFDASTNKDGNIDFLIRYYNGGCGFTEAIETALNNLK